MNALSFLFVAFVALQIVTFETSAETAETAEIKKPLDSAKQLTEIWQEDNREVLVRNSRGAKDVNGGKKKERNFSGSTKTPKTNRNQDNAKAKVNLLSQVTQQHEQVQNEKTHSNHQQKHKKNEHSHNKKHMNTTTTMKPKNKHENACRYTKSAWSECDQKTNQRSRTLTLKKGDTSCVQTRTIQKKCKKNKNEKACRYEKGPFSDCQPNGEMTRVDKLKASSDTVNCQQTRTVTKKCNAKSKQEKQPKGNSKDKKQKERKNHQ